MLGDERQLLAEFHLADTLRPEAPQAVHDLHSLGLSVCLLSGDAAATVASIAGRCRIGTWWARQAPAAKLEQVQGVIAAGRRVLMVGDGINDAPVLKGATVAAAMGRGSVLAQASADLVLANDDLGSLPLAIDVARRTLRIMRQNLAWAAAYNFCAVPLAALGLVPPWAAAIGMSLSSMIVVLNALRLAPGRAVPASRAISLDLQTRLSPAFGGRGLVMNIILVLIPLTLVLVVFAGWGFFWAVETGQFDDLDSPAWDVLAEDTAAPVCAVVATDVPDVECAVAPGPE